MKCKTMQKRTYVPDNKIYKETLTKLVENGLITTVAAVRLGCEMGLSRLEIVNAQVSDINRINRRGLWIEVAKRVRRGSKRTNGKKVALFEMRSREIPINSDLYQFLMAYINKNHRFILHREKGDITKPFSPRYVNTLYETGDIPWATHRSRHFFKSQVWSWMQKHHQPDTGLMKEYLGHQKDTTENYGEYSWDYKLEVVDNVFTTR